VDTLVLGAAVLLAREGVPALSDVAGAPWWVWPPGGCSMTFDQFGLLNLPVRSISLARLGAAALVIAGVFVVLRT
jgi:uncharacterized membrane protein YdcZ (DUF606 family)